jgi:hypothetical protein
MYLVFFVTGPQKVGTTSEIFTGAIRRMVLVWHKARAIYGRVIFFSGRVNGIVHTNAVALVSLTLTELPASSDSVSLTIPFTADGNGR